MIMSIVVISVALLVSYWAVESYIEVRVDAKVAEILMNRPSKGLLPKAPEWREDTSFTDKADVFLKTLDEMKKEGEL